MNRMLWHTTGLTIFDTHRPVHGPKMAGKTLVSTAAFARAKELRGSKLTSDLSKILVWELH